jgi:biotin carboxyl carrier protein
MYEAKVNGESSYSVVHKDGEFTLDGVLADADIHRINDHTFQVLFQGGSYTVHLLAFDHENGTVSLSINDKRAEVKLSTELDRMLRKLGMENLANTKISSVKAPMPGLIHSNLVAEGDEVSKGDPLIILEAMKMENIIKSPTDGTIKKIHAVKGASVEKGKVLIEFN